MYYVKAPIHEVKDDIGTTYMNYIILDNYTKILILSRFSLSNDSFSSYT